MNREVVACSACGDSSTFHARSGPGRALFRCIGVSQNRRHTFEADHPRPLAPRPVELPEWMSDYERSGVKRGRLFVDAIFASRKPGR